MSCQGLGRGKTGGLGSRTPGQPLRSHAPRSSQHASPNFLQMLLQTATLLSPTIFGAGWSMSAGSAKRQAAGPGWGRGAFACFSDLHGGLPYLGNAGDWSEWADNTYDVVLSSGFLAFASHSGFLKAIDSAGLAVSGVMGTSAGALTGSLYCAGYSPDEVAAELSRVAPIYLLRPSCRPWTGGAISLCAVVERLRELLPPTFEELGKDFAVGVVSKEGRYRLIDSGPLPEAVAASAAIPFVFAPVNVPGCEDGPFKDGGLVDRVGLAGWRRRRAVRASRNGGGGGNAHGAAPPALIHLIQRSSAFSGDDDVEATGERRITVVRSPKSGVNFLSLGNFEEQFDLAYARAMPAMRAVKLRSARRSPRLSAAAAEVAAPRLPDLQPQRPKITA